MIKSINLTSYKLNNQTRRNKAQRCAKELLKIFQSQLFRSLILNMDRAYWLKGESKSSTFLKLSNHEIYLKLMSGKEEWNNEVDYEIDLIVDDYYSIGRVVGYMNPGRPTVFVNTKFFDNMSRKKVASNFGHEYSHTCGARHSGKYFKQSFSYYLNEVIEYCYDYLITQHNDDIPHGTQVSPPYVKYQTICYRSWKWLWLRKTCKRIRI